MKTQRGFVSLVGLLVTIAIIAILMAVMLKGTGENKRDDGVGKTIIGQSVARAKDEVCIQQLSQVRQALQIQRIDDVVPASLSELPGLTPKYLKCPIGAEPYVYVPSAEDFRAQVTCPHPGHEKY